VKTELNENENNTNNISHPNSLNAKNPPNKYSYNSDSNINLGTQAET